MTGFLPVKVKCSLPGLGPVDLKRLFNGQGQVLVQGSAQAFTGIVLFLKHL